MFLSRDDWDLGVAFYPAVEQVKDVRPEGAEERAMTLRVRRRGVSASLCLSLLSQVHGHLMAQQLVQQPSQVSTRPQRAHSLHI